MFLVPKCAVKISSYFGVSHEQAYRKGVDSLLKLTEMVIANNEHSEIIKLFCVIVI